ncbi:MAG: helix-turn-helix transcriptional regulator [Bdellovibrionales bacterium]
MRLRRKFCGLSQKQLAKFVGVTFQQIQKYESGANRMGSSRLYQISQVLSVPVAYFFEDMPTLVDLQKRPACANDDLLFMKKDPMDDSNVLLRQETLKLVRAYYNIRNLKQRQKVHELVSSLSKSCSSEN